MFLTYCSVPGFSCENGLARCAQLSMASESSANSSQVHKPRNTPAAGGQSGRLWAAPESGESVTDSADDEKNGGDRDDDGDDDDIDLAKKRMDPLTEGHHNGFDYYKVFDDNLAKAKANTTVKQSLKDNFCHQCYCNRLQYDNDKFIFYCNFFGLDSEYLKENIRR
jgi:hypothetical protein